MPRNLFVLEGRVHEIVVIVSNINQVDKVRNAIEASPQRFEA